MNMVINSLIDRKSVRSFQEHPIPEDLRECIVDCALQAPTAGNQVLYTILDIRDRTIKEKLALLCDDQPFIASAPMVLIFLADTRRWMSIYRAAGIEPRKPGPGDLMIALADGLIAAQNSVTAAWSLGIGSCYIGDVLERREELVALLELPSSLMPAAMVVYGYPTERQLARKKPLRFSRDVIVRRDRYSDTDEEILKREFARINRMSAAENGTAGDDDVARAIKAFHDRKYASDFVLEMNRSAAGYIKEYLQTAEVETGMDSSRES